jgi:hypothetical protein
MIDPPYLPVSRDQILPTLNFVQYSGARFWIRCAPLSSPLSLLVPLSSNDVMEHTPITGTARLRAKMASHSFPSPISFRGPSDRILTAQPWQSCAPVMRRPRQNRKLNGARTWSAQSANAPNLAALEPVLDAVYCSSDLSLSLISVSGYRLINGSLLYPGDGRTCGS